MRWPSLKAVTAREYLDGVSEAYFKTVVTPVLDHGSVSGKIHYTKDSIDEWIARGCKTRQTGEEDEEGGGMSTTCRNS
jgi:hypothetical protein